LSFFLVDLKWNGPQVSGPWVPMSKA